MQNMFEFNFHKDSNFSFVSSITELSYQCFWGITIKSTSKKRFVREVVNCLVSRRCRERKKASSSFSIFSTVPWIDLFVCGLMCVSSSFLVIYMYINIYLYCLEALKSSSITNKSFVSQSFLSIFFQTFSFDDFLLSVMVLWFYWFRFFSTKN